MNVDATFEDIKAFLLPKGGKKIKLIHKTENNEKIFSGAIMIDFDTIEENKVSSRMDLQILILQIRNAIAEFEICI